VEQPPLWLHSVIGKGALTIADSQSQALNLQHGDQVIRSLLEEWIAKQAQGRKTKDQTDRKAFPDLDDGTSRTQPSYFSPSVPEPSVDSPSGTSPESSIDPNQRANIQEAGGRSSVGRPTISGITRLNRFACAWGAFSSSIAAKRPAFSCSMAANRLAKKSFGMFILNSLLA
jgi:hypothetical protein